MPNLGINTALLDLEEPAPLDLTTKGKAFDRLLVRGTAAMLREHAGRMDAIAAGLTQYRPVRQPSKAEQECARLKDDLYVMELHMAAACLFSFTGIWEPCVIWTVAYYATKTYIREYKQCDV